MGDIQIMELFVVPEHPSKECSWLVNIHMHLDACPGPNPRVVCMPRVNSLILMPPTLHNCLTIVIFYLQYWYHLDSWGCCSSLCLCVAQSLADLPAAPGVLCSNLQWSRYLKKWLLGRPSLKWMQGNAQRNEVGHCDIDPITLWVPISTYTLVASTINSILL